MTQAKLAMLEQKLLHPTEANLATNKMEHCSRVSALPLDDLDNDTDIYEEPWNKTPN